MSRWSDTFINHQFNKDWANLQKALNNAKIDDESVLSSVEELARLKKVTRYLDGLLNLIDAELIPLSTWDTFQAQLSPCVNEISNFNSNRDINHLRNANAHADNLLSYLRPWVVINPVDSVVSMRDALSDYHKSIDEYSETYRTNGRDLLAELKSKKTTIVRIEEELEEVRGQINKYHHEIFESEGSNVGIKDHIQDLLKTFEAEKNKVSEFYKEALVGDEANNSIKKKVLDALSLIQQEQNKAFKYIESISVERKELEEFYSKVFGDENSENEKIKGGLKEEIDRRIKQLDTFYGEQKTKHDAQFQEIESLLPGATSAGLANAFFEMKRSFDTPIGNFTRMFYDSIALIITLAIVAMIDRIAADGVHFVHYENIGEFASTLGWKLPVIGAAVWLAVFASKRRSEMQRLQQEYAHKEALAKSYHGFKKQIESLNQEDQEMLKSLMSKAIDSIADNASKTLDGNHGDKTPLQELVETVIPSLEKIKKSVSS